MFTGRIKNEYGAIVDQAVFVIDDAKLYEKEAVTTIKCTHFKFDADNPNNHKSSPAQAKPTVHFLRYFLSIMMCG